MRSFRQFALLFPLLLLPVLASASAIHVPSHAKALGISGSLYHATDYTGFEGTVNLTLRGVFDLGFSVQRSDMDGLPDSGLEDLLVSAENVAGPTAYAPGTKMTTYEPSAAYTVRLPGRFLVSIGGAYQWSGRATRPVDSYLYEQQFEQKGLRVSSAVSRYDRLGRSGVLVPRLGLEYRWGRLESRTEVQSNLEDVPAFLPTSFDTVVEKHDELAFVAGVDAVMRFGRRQIVSIGPHLSIGQETTSYQLVLGYALVSW